MQAVKAQPGIIFAPSAGAKRKPTQTRNAKENSTEDVSTRNSSFFMWATYRSWPSTSSEISFVLQDGHPPLSSGFGRPHPGQIEYVMKGFIFCRTSKMSHASGRRAACLTTFLILRFHFEIPSVARGVTATGVGSGALFG